MTKIRQEAAEKTKYEQQKLSERDKSKKTQKESKFKIGDLVLRKDTPNAQGQSLKLKTRFKGPYKIVKCLTNDRYRIHSDFKTRKYDSVHAGENLKPFRLRIE